MPIKARHIDRRHPRQAGRCIYRWILRDVRVQMLWMLRVASSTFCRLGVARPRSIGKSQEQGRRRWCMPVWIDRASVTTRGSTRARLLPFLSGRTYCGTGEKYLRSRGAGQADFLPFFCFLPPWPWPGCLPIGAPTCSLFARRGRKD
jgi:hypothetical protein